MAELTGQTFAGYEIIAKLGQGGMGAVYKARQPVLNRFVALKVMSSDLASDRDFVARFKREANAAAALNHENIVQVFSAGEFEGSHFIAMEFVEGTTLRHHIESHGRLDPREAIAITILVAQALQHAWNKARLIHRDIKPDNIFLSHAGEVKVGDLGLAKTVGGSTTSLTQTGTAMGSPHYISPEQATGAKEIDFRTDIYSLGGTLYHMLTGQTPYSGDSSMVVMMKHVNDPPPAIFKVWPQCPMPLGLLVGKMLAKNRNSRPASYEQLIEQLREVHDKLRPFTTAPAPISTSEPTQLLTPTPKPAPAPPQPTPKLAVAKATTRRSTSAAKARSVVGDWRFVAGGVALVVLLASFFVWAPWRKGREGAEAQLGAPLTSVPAQPSALATTQPSPTAGRARQRYESIFPVVLYGGPFAPKGETDERSETSQAWQKRFLEAIRDIGFNGVAGKLPPPMITRAGQMGMWAVAGHLNVKLLSNPNLTEQEARDSLAETMALCQQHKNMIASFLYTDPVNQSWLNGWSVTGRVWNQEHSDVPMLATYGNAQQWKQFDTAAPIGAAQGWAFYNNLTRSSSPPARELPSSFCFSVAPRDARRQMPGLPVWPWVQCFGGNFENYRWPTDKEYRAAHWLMLVEGVRGAFYWKYAPPLEGGTKGEFLADTNNEPSQRLLAMKSFLPAFARMGAELLAYEIDDTRQPTVRGKAIASLYVHKSDPTKQYLVIASRNLENAQKVTVTFDSGGQRNIKSLKDYMDGAEIPFRYEGASAVGEIELPPTGGRLLAVARESVEKTMTISAGIELVAIPPGEFMLGSTKEEQAWAVRNGCPEPLVKGEGEAPRKTRIKDGFWLGRTEVTVGQWKQFVAATGYRTEAERLGEAHYAYNQQKKMMEQHVKGASWRDPGFDQQDNHPVCCVSWNDAAAFCAWLTAQEQKAGQFSPEQVVRLPTEAEWEYACRAGTQSKFWWGELEEDGENRLNQWGVRDGFEFTSPVDSYGKRGRNRFGLADMQGNVREWCLNDYDATGAHEEPYKGGSARVVRGGSFGNNLTVARCASRESFFPNSPNCYNGFRVCLGPDVLGSAAPVAPAAASEPQAALAAGPSPKFGVLFDGRDTSAWQQRDGGDCQWEVKDGELVAGQGDLDTREKFQDFKLHIEFAVPRDAKQGNSGIYLQGRYEVQILESHGKPADNTCCGSIFGLKAPTENASKPPDEWQTFDIGFRAAQFDAAGNKTANARVSVVHNGKLIHDYVEIPRSTGKGEPESAAPGPIRIQSYGSPVRFRNISIRPVDEAAAQTVPAGFVSLFNGKDLTGWEGRPEFWSVQDGAIYGATTKESPAQKNTFLVCTAGEFSDFELRAQFKMAAGDGQDVVNSGVQYRSQIIDREYFTLSGYQADLGFMGKKNLSGGFWEEAGRRVLSEPGQRLILREGASQKSPQKTVESIGSADDIMASYKEDDWNDLLIIASGNRLQHYLNGKLASEVIDETAAAAKTGTLALQIKAGPPMRVWFRNLFIKKLGSDASTTPADTGWQNAINLLPLIDPEKDAGAGTWTLEAGALVSSFSSGNTKLEIPYQPPEEYDFRVEFSLETTGGAVGQRMAKSGRCFVWLMGGYGGRTFGFDAVGGRQANENPTHSELDLQRGRRYISVVRVRNGQVSALLDGSMIAAWKTDYQDMGMSRWWKPRNQALLGVVCYKGRVVFHRIEVREVTGKGTFTRAAPTAAVNLLPLVDPQKDAVEGTWTRVDGGLTSDIVFGARLQLPYEPPEEYDFQISFTRLNFQMKTRYSGWGDTNLILAKDGRQFKWFMGAHGNTWFGFDIVNGQRFDKNPTGVKVEECLQLNRRYTSRVEVRKDSVKAYLDDKLITAWKPEYGPLQEGTYHPLPNKKVLGIGSCNVQTVFHTVEVCEVTGKGTLTRPAP